MTDFEKLGVFYLGREYDIEAKQQKDDLILYDSKDLVTHAVCVGMTGSGKTGLCISLLEEAVLDGIPALVIDPKGDLLNLLLTFPDLKPDDFKPWVRTEDPTQQAEFWKSGLAKWGQDGARIATLKGSADFTIFTPGSNAGMPVSIVKSFAAPSAELAADRELMRDRVAATATALLSLVGLEDDPLQSREHILVSTILDTAWREGKNLDLANLIQQVQTPAVSRIGVLDVEAFFPSKDRFKLAMQLNNLLASPGFEAWLEGDPLDVQNLLYTPFGKPRVSIFSIAHLSDAERMFFVALLLNQTLSWMRAQQGTTSLRALLYMDEIYGYFPPTANPPSKKPLLTLLKQARAFGLGVVLATQNPADLDYKGLSNIGTWFIGRLQTDRDKQRLLDGLLGAADGKFDRAELDQLLSRLSNRVFLMKGVKGGTEVFETRWAMSYLRGPLTRDEIKLLMDAKKSAAPVKQKATLSIAAAKPVLPPGIDEKFVPVRGSATTYSPVLMAAAQVRFVDPKQSVDQAREVVYGAPIVDGVIAVNWEEAEETEIGLDELEAEAQPGVAFAELPSAAIQVKNYKTWSKDFANWLYGSQSYDLFYSASTEQTSNAGESERDFRLRLQQVAREQRDAAVAQLRQQYDAKIKPLDDRIFRAQQALDKEREQSRSQTIQGVLNVGMSVLGMVFGGKRKSSMTSVMTGVRSAGRVYKETQDVDRVGESVERLQQEKAAREAELAEQTKQLQAGPDPLTEPLEKIQIKPKKTNITVRFLGLVWKPE